MSATVVAVHSMPVDIPAAACSTRWRPAGPALRGGVLGFGAFRSSSPGPVAHRLLPIAAVAVVIDVDTGLALVTGARGRSGVDGPTTWGHGVTIGFAPGGVEPLLGVRAGELAGVTAGLEDVVGRRGRELVERLAEAPGWGPRLDLLARVLPRWAPGRLDPVDRVARAWWRLQQPGRQRVADVARDLGIARRRLELAFRDQVGLTPGTVARVARFQRFLSALGTGTALAEAAAACGFADQAHATRETRTLLGMTPAELRAHAIVQDPAGRAA